MFDTMRTEALKALESNEPIHLIDGGYSKGYIPVLTLIQMIHDGLAEEYIEGGQSFVKAKCEHKQVV